MNMPEMPNNNMVDMDRLALNDRLYPPLSRNHYTDPNGMVRARSTKDGNADQY